LSEVETTWKLVFFMVERLAPTGVQRR
jgi:hypothetical protein